MPFDYRWKYEYPVRVIHEIRKRLPHDSAIRARLKSLEFGVSYGMSWRKAIVGVLFDWKGKHHA